MVNIFRPDVVLLSGGVCNQGTYLTDPLNVYIKNIASLEKELLFLLLFVQH